MVTEAGERVQALNVGVKERLLDDFFGVRLSFCHPCSDGSRVGVFTAYPGMRGEQRGARSKELGCRAGCTVRN